MFTKGQTHAYEATRSASSIFYIFIHGDARNIYNF